MQFKRKGSDQQHRVNPYQIVEWFAGDTEDRAGGSATTTFITLADGTELEVDELVAVDTKMRAFLGPDG